MADVLPESRQISFKMSTISDRSKLSRKHFSPTERNFGQNFSTFGKMARTLEDPGRLSIVTSGKLDSRTAASQLKMTKQMQAKSPFLQ